MDLLMRRRNIIRNRPEDLLKRGDNRINIRSPHFGLSLERVSPARSHCNSFPKESNILMETRASGKARRNVETSNDANNICASKESVRLENKRRKQIREEAAEDFPKTEKRSRSPPAATPSTSKRSKRLLAQNTGEGINGDQNENGLEFQEASKPKSSSGKSSKHLKNESSINDALDEDDDSEDDFITEKSLNDSKTKKKAKYKKGKGSVDRSRSKPSTLKDVVADDSHQAATSPVKAGSSKKKSLPESDSDDSERTPSPKFHWWPPVNP